MKEKYRPLIEAGYSVGAIALVTSISFFAFNNRLKHEIRAEQQYRCACCGDEPKKLQVHHKVPQSMGGNDTKANAIGFCPNCHDVIDDEVLNGNVVWPNTPLQDAPDELFKSVQHKQKILIKRGLVESAGVGD